MNKLTAERSREQFEQWFRDVEAGDDDNWASPPYLSREWHEYLARRQLALGAWNAALEIALPVLEQQEKGEMVRVAFTGSGSLEAIKRGEEGFIWGSKADAHPIELFVHCKDAVCAKCSGTGMADSGGTQPWGEQILVECDCQFEQQERERGEEE